jgi:hypothetical protein
MTGTKRAGAYCISNGILIHPVARTDAGVGVHVPPVVRLQLDASAAALGAAVRTALQQDQPAIPNPARHEWKSLADRFLKATGIRSWRRLESHALCCWIEATDEIVRFTPLANGGTRGDRKGFQPFGAPEVTVPQDRPDEAIGEALLRTLAACR